MKFKIEKNLRIVNELMTYCYNLGSTDVKVHIKNEDNHTIIKVCASVDSVRDSIIEKLNKVLNTQRQHEIEQYYWHLGGESELDDELSLIGMMIDKATVSFESGVLEIQLIRKEEAF